ncbi:hypothetical protein MWH28_09945 [Natroniella sulfidigena]|uniref:hypothetical protein n=1 Tax=Natroniella sulfidigena TaxID=723921 RepID=UPI00200A2D8B|nr:hypothetical protein [Natroniella sulfidigena]MCK8817680.1 hypothetical protein [Natroniella sulfidigena]
MKTDKIAKEITIKMLDNNNNSPLLTADSSTNEHYTNEVAKFYKTIYKAIEEAKRESK